MITTLLVGWSLGWLVARSLVFEPVRNLLSGLSSVFSSGRAVPWRVLGRLTAALLVVTHCAACSGFWIGCGLSLFGSYVGVVSPMGTLPTGLAVMGVNALLDACLAMMVTITTRDDDHERDERGETDG